MTKLYALTQRFGIPSVFLTISPDDVHNVLGIRLSYPVQSNHEFPTGDCGETLLTALRTNVPDLQLNIPVHETHLQHLATLNPVASATVFQKLMDAVIYSLLQFPNLNNRKTIPVSERRKGIFGKILAFCSVLETQGRLALHAHKGIWTLLNPLILQNVAAYPLLVAHIASILDDMFLAHMPAEQHVNGLVRRLNAQPATRAAFEVPLNSSINTTCAQFWDRVYQSMDTFQIHSHRETCHNGGPSCRMAKPSGLVSFTGAVELEIVEDEEDNSISYEILPSITEEDHVNGHNRNRLTHPLPKEDARCIAWELKRPLIDISFLFSDRQIPADILRDLHLNNVISLDNYFANADRSLINYELPPLTDQQIGKLARALLKRNGSVVDVNATATSVLNCNTAAYLLGGKQQAKSALFYLLKYLTKDGVQLANSLAVLHSARQHIEQYPSIAVNTGTTQRIGQHFLLRCINSFSGQSEVSSTQAAASLLGMNSQTFSTNFIYLYIKPAIEFVIQQQNILNIQAELEINDTAENNNTPEEELIDTTLLNEESLPEVVGNRQNSHSFGGVPVYTLNGEHIPVAQHLHYRFRGEQLISLSLYEYFGCISVKKRPEQNENNQGRSNNTHFEFAAGHPLTAGYVQCIRSKQVCPILAGAPPPKTPTWNTLERPSRLWRSQCNTFAKYYLTLFKPWDIETGTITAPLNWETFGIFMHNLESPPPGQRVPSFIGRNIAQLITNISNNLRVNTKHKSVLTQYRTRAATQWQSRTSDWTDVCEVQTDDHHNGVTLNEQQQQATIAIDTLRAASRADDPCVQRNLANKHVIYTTYNNHTLEALQATLGNRELTNQNDMLNFQTPVAHNLTVVDIDSMITLLSTDNVDTISITQSTNGSTTSVQQATIPTVTRVQPNLQQSQVLSEFETYINQYDAYIHDRSQPKPVAPHSFINGGPGVGKVCVFFSFYFCY
jgi:hypothetical protein